MSMKKTLKTVALVALGGVGGYLARPKLEPVIQQLVNRFAKKPAPVLPAPVPPKASEEITLYTGGNPNFNEAAGGSSLPSDWVGA
jgi:hypothetical protein